MKKQAIIFEALVKLAKLYGHPDFERLTLYAQALEEYELEKIHSAIIICSQNCKFFPSLKELLDCILPPPLEKRDEANEIAGVILGSISRFGRNNIQGIYKLVGPIGQLAIERFGGWEVICNTSTDDLSTTRAQLRDAVQSVLALQHRPESRCILPYQKEGAKHLAQHFANLQLEN